MTVAASPRPDLTRGAASLPAIPGRVIVYAALGALLLAYPWVASGFWIVQIGAQSLFLGVIALSLMFLGGYGGMVSLSQMTVAGFAGYAVAIIGSNANHLLLGWPLWIAVPLALILAVLLAIGIGLISARTAGIYTIMITIAIGVAFFYFTRQNYVIFNGHSGFAGLEAPTIFGLDLRQPEAFYYLSLFTAVLSYAGVLYISRSTFGLGLQAIRDNPRRMNALGFNVTAYRVSAHGVAGLIAALGGILYVWMNGRVSPGTIDIGPMLNILIIAVLGGIGHPIGPFVGALVFVLLRNFAIDLVSPERFNTFIGLIFLLVVFVSRDGLLGLYRQAVDWARRNGGGGQRDWRKKGT